MIVATMIEVNKFALLASDTQIEHTMQALEANNIHAIVVENGADAKKKLFEMIPVNAGVFISSSTTSPKKLINRAIMTRYGQN